MMNRFVAIVILIPLAIILIAFGVANRGATSLTLDPFNPGNPALTYNAPLFVWLFGALALGLIIGGFSAWLAQGRVRQIARQRLADEKAAAKRERESVRQAMALTTGAKR